MGKKNSNKKTKFRAINPEELGEVDKKVTASTSRTAGATRQEAVEDIPLPTGPGPRSYAAKSASSNQQKVQNGECDRQTDRAKVQFGFKVPKTPPHPKPEAFPQYNEPRNQAWGPKLPDSAAAGGSPFGAWGNQNQQSKKSDLNINAKAFQPSSFGRTQTWDSSTDDSCDTKRPVEPVENFNQVDEQTTNWPEELHKEEEQSQIEFKEPIEEITNQWSTATNLDQEQDNEGPWEQKQAKEHKGHTNRNDNNDWRNGDRRKSGEAAAGGSSRWGHDRNRSPQRSHDKERSYPQRTFRSSYEKKGSSPSRSFDKRGSSPPRSSDKRRSSPPSGFDDDWSTPQKSSNRRSSPQRGSFGGGREGPTPSWGERGTSSERDSEYKDFCNLARSKDKPEYVTVKEIDGDLFAQPKEYSLAHCVAEDMGMGSGIAVQFRRDFKRVDELLNQRQKQGGLAVLEHEDRRIYYLVTKRISSGKPTYHTLFSSLKKLRQDMLDHGISKLAVPRIGCGLDRLEWSYVKHMLEYVFREVEVEIIVCNFQQDENVPPTKLKRGHLVNYEKPIQEIEDGTIIIYTTSAEDDDISPEMKELDKKFPSLLVQYRSSRKRPGQTVLYDKNSNYRLYGCVVKPKKDDPFDYVEFQKCIGAIEKDNRKLGYWYIAFQAMTDPKDDLINEKVINIVRNGVRNVDVYVCSAKPE